MKTCIGALGVLAIIFAVSACGDKEDSSAFFTVGGVVNGSTGTLVLRNNGGDDLAVAADGPFTFPAAMATGRAYAVTVRTPPVGQTCIVSRGTGTIVISNVTNVSVECAARGGLDAAFNAPHGFVTQNNAAGGNGDDSAYGVAVDPQGRVLVTGSSTSTGGTTDMVVWRFSADGTLDATLNGTGMVVHDNAAGGNGNDTGNAVVVAPDGGILVTGSSATTGGMTDMAIWRFNADGTLDANFNRSGIVLHDRTAAGGGSESGNAIAIDRQGNILVTGSTSTAGGATDMAIWRFNANGTVDTTFNLNGMVVHHNAAGGNGDDVGNAVAVDSQGRILVTGSSTTAGGTTDMVVWRYKYDGTLDTTFNAPKGFVVHHSAAGGNGDDSGNAIALDPQGRILVAGFSMNSRGDRDMAVWRYKADGTPDTTFGFGGIVFDNGAAGSNGDDVGNAIAVDSQGRILVTGSSTNKPGDLDMVVWRFNADGSFDITFAYNGILTHDSAAGGNGNDAGRGIAVDPQDRIVVGGSSGNGADDDMAVWRVFP